MGGLGVGYIAWLELLRFSYDYFSNTNKIY
jgi:hypothetical protein